ncbi:MAG: lytic murein transglycosylase [Alphaproteobacteria bacterium]|nr:lytic murein transglycosylase [Alphaproteobacteria bacterium]
MPSLRTGLAGAILAAFLLVSGPACAAQSFEDWLEGVRAEAAEHGISKPILTKTLSGIEPLPRVIELDRRQPEGKITFAEYRKNMLNEERIRRGQTLYREHRGELERAAKEYGVPASFILALWGIETSYGANTGGFGVIPALATLAYDGRRSHFFRKELMEALTILEEGHIAPDLMKGSWAGAMGQNQFMPSSFRKFAIDGNGDERRDIWNSLPDVFASTAHYLDKNGWRAEEGWGEAVVLPRDFPESLLSLEMRMTPAEWTRMGVRLPNGRNLRASAEETASIVAPDGPDGPAFLVYENYRVIMRWNKSLYFATSVGLLADAISGQP